MAKSFNFDTGYISVTSGYDSRLKITGSITRTSSSKIKITANATSRYNMQARFVVHFAYGTSYKEFSGSYPDITNGYTEISAAEKEITIITYDPNGTTENIHTDKEVTVPDGDLYFAIWFTATDYYNQEAGYQDYSVIGGKSINTKLDSYYTAPSNYHLYIDERTSTSITPYHTWDVGSESIKTNTITIGSTTKTIGEGSNNKEKFSGLTPNTKYTITGKISDGTSNTGNTKTAERKMWTKLDTPTDILQTGTDYNVTTSLILRAISNNGTSGLKYKYRITYLDNTTSDWITKDYGSGNEITFTGLTSNSKYKVEAKAYNADNGWIDEDGNITTKTTESSTYSETFMTRPAISTITLSLPDKYQHNSIKVTVAPTKAATGDVYAIKLNSNSFTDDDYTTSKTKTFNNLDPNTNYTIYVRMKNSEGFLSATKSDSITTWHAPISNLSVVLTNQWYWRLGIKPSFTYSGSIEKYECSITTSGTNYEVGTLNTNKIPQPFIKGTTTGGDTNNLTDNTSYSCKIRLTDNHGRTASASATYKTLDERPLYVNGSLKEVKVIKSDGTVKYITPDLLTVIKSDGTKVNMNDVINPDRLSTK